MTANSKLCADIDQHSDDEQDDHIIDVWSYACSYRGMKNPCPQHLIDRAFLSQRLSVRCEAIMLLLSTKYQHLIWFAGGFRSWMAHNVHRQCDTAQSRPGDHVLLPDGHETVHRSCAPKSTSTSRTRAFGAPAERRTFTSPKAMLVADVDLPMPPLWFVSTSVRVMSLFLCTGDAETKAGAHSDKCAPVSICG